MSEDTGASASERDRSAPTPSVVTTVVRTKQVRTTIKVLLFALVLWVFVLPLIPGFRKALTELREVQPLLLGLGIALQVSSWYCYSLLTRAALGEAGRPISAIRMFRIQMSTKAMTNIVPGGSAAGPALGYRLLTLSGVRGPDAGFALATAGIGSALVLNLIFWLALLISIPRGVSNPFYVLAAIAGLMLMLIAAFLVMGLMDGQGRAERALRWIARKLHTDEDRAARVIRRIASRLEEVLKNPGLMGRVAGWAAVNWLLDAASLWVFLRAFGGTLDPISLLVAFGLGNIVAVIPITPGGLGIVDGVYLPTLVGFGLTRSTASLGFASYRIAQFFLPVLVGGIVYLSLRVGPFRIERRESRLASLRELARDDDITRETRVDWVLRNHEDVHRHPAGRGLSGDPVDGSVGSDPPP